MANFCLLEKDKKTFRILNKYFEDLKINKNLWNEDQELQIEEMILHSQYKGYKADAEWVEQNAKNYRIYLNAIKVLATIFYCSGIEITWENFTKFVDRYDECECFFLEKIHI